MGAFDLVAFVRSLILLIDDSRFIDLDCKNTDVCRRLMAESEALGHR